MAAKDRRVEVRRILLEQLIFWTSVTYPFLSPERDDSMGTLFGLRRTQPICFKLSFSSFIESFQWLRTGKSN